MPACEAALEPRALPLQRPRCLRRLWTSFITTQRHAGWLMMAGVVNSRRGLQAARAVGGAVTAMCPRTDWAVSRPESSARRCLSPPPLRGWQAVGRCSLKLLFMVELQLDFFDGACPRSWGEPKLPFCLSFFALLCTRDPLPAGQHIHTSVRWPDNVSRHSQTPSFRSANTESTWV